MSKWNIPITAWTEIEVEADNKEDAVKKAMEEARSVMTDWDYEVTDNIVQNLSDGKMYVL